MGKIMANKNSDNLSNASLIPKTLLVFLITLIFMILYQLTKHFLISKLSLFQSNIITIIFASVVAAIASFFIFKTFHKLIIKKQAEVKKQEIIYEKSTQNAALLNSLIEVMDDAILAIDNAGNVIIGNQKFIDLWRVPTSLIESGSKEEQMEFILEQLNDPVSFSSSSEKIIKQPNKDSYDKLELKDGRTIERKSKPIKVNNKTIGRVWSYRDITRSQHFEDVIIESEKTYKAIFNNSSDGMFLIKDVFLDCNEAVCKLFDCEKKDIIGKSPIEFSPEIQPDGQKSEISAKDKIE